MLNKKIIGDSLTPNRVDLTLKQLILKLKSENFFAPSPYFYWGSDHFKTQISLVKSIYFKDSFQKKSYELLKLLPAWNNFTPRDEGVIFCSTGQKNQIYTLKKNKFVIIPQSETLINIASTQNFNSKISTPLHKLGISAGNPQLVLDLLDASHLLLSWLISKNSVSAPLTLANKILFIEENKELFPEAINFYDKQLKLHQSLISKHFRKLVPLPSLGFISLDLLLIPFANLIKDEPILDILNDLLNPTKLGFKHFNYNPQSKIPANREVWFKGSFYAIEASFFSEVIKNFE